MNHWRNRSRVALYAAATVALLGAGPAAGPAAAQQQVQVDSQPFKAWTLVCTRPQQGQPRQCYINQQVPPGGGKAVELGMTIFLNGAQQRPVMRIRLPLAAQAGKEIALVIDQSQPLKAPIAGCSQDRCVVQGGLDDTVIKAMRAGRVVDVTYLGAGSKQVVVHVSLSGFSAAMDALRKSGS